MRPEDTRAGIRYVRARDIHVNASRTVVTRYDGRDRCTHRRDRQHSVSPTALEIRVGITTDTTVYNMITTRY